ncbi:hypothetical protein NFI96_017995, partial [Prochilodus magdalenae]
WTLWDMIQVSGPALSMYLTDPTATAVDIQRAVVSSMSHPVGASTIGSRLHHAGLHAHRPLPRLSLLPRHRHQRLQWCRTRLSWSDSEWQRVIFSDESRFSLGGDAQRIRVWRHRGQHQDERFVVTCPEGPVSLHLHPYRTICRNCVRMFKLHGMDYHRTPLGTSTAPYRDVWVLANTTAADAILRDRLLSVWTAYSAMGRIFLDHIGGTRLFSCANCDTILTNRSELISTRFTGATGRAFLFNKARIFTNLQLVSDFPPRGMPHEDTAAINLPSMSSWWNYVATKHGQREVAIEHVVLAVVLLHCALCPKVVNLQYSEVQDRVMLTGRHMVRDVSCKNCNSKLGWIYEFATEDSQRYKEGRVILERALVRESEGFEEHIPSDAS